MTQDLISSKYLTVDYDEPETPEASSTAESSDIFVETPRPNRKFPTGLIVLCGLFVLISMIGMYSAVNKLTTLYFHKTESVDLSSLGNDSRSRRFKREIREMENRAAETQTKYLPYMTYNEILKFGLAVGFAIAVGLLIIRYPKARKFAMTVCCVAMFYHISAITITCLSTAEVLGPMGNFLDASASNVEEYQSMSAAEKADAQQAFSRAMTGGFILFIGFYLIIKFAFYGGCLLYLGRPEIRDLFENQPETPAIDVSSTAPESELAPIQMG